MVELIRTNDLVHLSWAQAMLAGAGIPFLLADLHTSSVEGGIDALPRRLLVPEDDLARARRTLDEAARAVAPAEPDGGP
jgi:Putative prokaryotic signal transducing protein